jgi:hypothetical protein
MKETLKVYVINIEKSLYRLELIKSARDNLYISISHTIYSYINEEKVSQILIRPENLDAIIDILVHFRNEIPDCEPKKNSLSLERKQELINRYLNKGLEIEALAVQFKCSAADIRQILFEENIFITSNKIPVPKSKRRFWKKKFSLDDINVLG